MKNEIVKALRFSVVYTVLFQLFREIPFRHLINEIDLKYFLETLVLMLISGLLYILVMRLEQKKKNMKSGQEQKKEKR
jgi:hypothetical protein